MGPHLAFITGSVASLTGLGTLLHVGDALDRCDDTVLWSGAERRMDRRTGSSGLRALGRPCSSCCTSCTVLWSFLHNIWTKKRSKGSVLSLLRGWVWWENHGYKLSAFRIYLLDSLPIILIHLLESQFLIHKLDITTLCYLWGLS